MVRKLFAAISIILLISPAFASSQLTLTTEFINYQKDKPLDVTINWFLKPDNTGTEINVTDKCISFITLEKSEHRTVSCIITDSSILSGERYAYHSTGTYKTAEGGTETIYSDTHSAVLQESFFDKLASSAKGIYNGISDWLNSIFKKEPCQYSTLEACEKDTACFWYGGKCNVEEKLEVKQVDCGHYSDEENCPSGCEWVSDGGLPVVGWFATESCKPCNGCNSYHEQYEKCINCGCDWIQGKYCIDKQVPAEEPAVTEEVQESDEIESSSQGSAGTEFEVQDKSRLDNIKLYVLSEGLKVVVGDLPSSFDSVGGTNTLPDGTVVLDIDTIEREGGSYLISSESGYGKATDLYSDNFNFKTFVGEFQEGINFCAINEEGDTYCSYQLDPFLDSFRHPVKVSSPYKFESIATCGLNMGYFCGLTGEGEIYCWNPDNIAFKVSGADKYDELYGQEYYTSCVIYASRNGEIYYWDGPETIKSGAEPKKLPGNHAISKVSCSWDHCCALTKNDGQDPDGTAYCWGFSYRGQLGNGFMSPRWEKPLFDGFTGEKRSFEPVKVGGGNKYVSIYSGITYTCALDNEGIAYCWGYSERGLGIAANAPFIYPQKIEGEYRFKYLSTQEDAIYGSTIEGKTVVFGINPKETAIGGRALDDYRSLFFHIGLSEERVTYLGLTKKGTTYCWGFECMFWEGYSAMATWNPQPDPIHILGHDAEMPAQVKLAEDECNVYQLSGIEKIDQPGAKIYGVTGTTTMDIMIQTE